ncbi:MAG: hypothetical protein L6R30_25880 [Thermoanaerobaculia bacterium]|nr:hypothetical protein [Thermoanaerobaculia bacterium]
MLGWSEPPATQLARIVADVLANDSELAAFFEDRIASAENAELLLPQNQHVLYVLPVSWKPQGQCGGRQALEVTLKIRAYLPRTAPAVGYVPIPSFSVLNPGSLYQYRLTQFTDRAESFASDPVGAAGLATLPLPGLVDGVKGYRVWRSEPNRTACRWIATVFTGGEWTDTGAPGRDEIAPVRGISDRILGHIESVLRREDNEYLPEGTQYNADALLEIRPQPPQISTRRNAMAYEMEAVYQTIYDPRTQEIRVGGLN